MNGKLLRYLVFLALIIGPLAARAGINDVFKGWAWNSVNSGWISVNSVNTGAAQDYGLKLDSGGNVFGWAWSSNLGWICFGVTCPGDPPGAPVASWALYVGALEPHDDSGATPKGPRLTGWGRLYSLVGQPGQQGWVSLSCENTGACGTSKYHVDVDLTNGALKGYAWDGAGGTYAGGIPQQGLGWVRFDPQYPSPPCTAPCGGVAVGSPRLQALFGDIYTKGTQYFTPSQFAAGLQLPNATFCLDKGPTTTITNFSQGQCGNVSSGYNFNVNTGLNFPKGGTNYVTTLGRLDLPGMRAGRFGTRVIVGNLTTDVPSLLAGKIYDTNVSGNYSWGGQTFVNSASATTSGAGTVIVVGNLTITGNLNYPNPSPPLSSLKQLASLGILVLDDGSGTKGNVTIAPAVTFIGANIYAEGTVSTGTTGVPGPITDPMNPGFASQEKPLVISGVLVAKAIRFERQYYGFQPSEQVIYDGRIAANTPPGMTDFVQSLPQVYEGVPQ